MESCNLLNSPAGPDIDHTEVKTAGTLPQKKHERYRSISGSLLCLAVKSQHDTAFAASVLESYFAAATMVNMIQAINS